jgi:phospholipid/cholesterol/gamma-HCH transport system substrate-binding protein
MEVQARYTLMGLFAVAVIFFVFGFVYWLDAAGGLAKRSSYQIRFDGPVAGLLRGSAVLFNGVRVGEVSDLKLEAARPQEVLVEIAIDRSTPVRRDTKVGIDFQGLTGAPVVSLVGGLGTAPVPSGQDGEMALLTAEKGAGEGVTQLARQVLSRLDHVITENSEPLRNAIASISTFSSALARNSEKVDGILAGLERFAGGSKKETTIKFDVLPAKFERKPAKLPAGQLFVPEPIALALLDSQLVQVGGSEADKIDLSAARWPDVLSRLLQTRIIQSFENAGYLGAMGRPPGDVKTDHRLLIDVRAFDVDAGPSPAANIELTARLVNNDGRLVASRIFRAARPLEALRPKSALKALQESAQVVFAELVLWACEEI